MQDDDGWIEMEDDGFIALVGPFWHRPFDGGPVSWFRFRAEDKHRNRGGVVQGGMLMTFADRSLGFTVRRGDMMRRQATVQLDTQFIRPVRIGDVVELEGRITHETRSLAFVTGILSVKGEPVMTAQGVWKIFRNPPGGSERG